jgi:radical SAM protein with 4Fe4S-binding SPASM domain
MSKIPSKTFCTLPWIHLNTQPNGDIYPCCMAPYGDSIGNTKDNTLKEVWNGDDMKSIRKDMLKGERPKACSRCFLIEDAGMHSPRHTHNKLFNDQIEDLIKDTDPETGHNPNFNLKYWDFRWSNICNFKCRMCGVFSSSKWAEDEPALYGTNIEAKGGIVAYNDTAKEDVMQYVDKHLHEVEEIYFAGGEPLVMEEHYLILEKLIKAGRTDVRLRYNTNFSHLKFKKWDLFGMWQKFIDDPKGNIQLFASLDAIGKLAEVIRSGTKWNVVESNIKRCVEAGMEVHFSPTVSLLNIFYIHELIELAEKVGINVNCVNLNNLLTHPNIYDIRILPDYLKEKLCKQLDDYIADRRHNPYIGVLEFGYSAWKNHMYTDIDFNKNNTEIELLRSSTILDRRRKEAFLEVNPQFTEWFADIRTRINNPKFFDDKITDKERKTVATPSIEKGKPKVI